MEENLSIAQFIMESVQLEAVDIKTYSPLTLAYIGDGIYELVIRTMLVGRGNKQVQKLHKEASALVKAQNQSNMMEVIEPLLEEEEANLYRRGRNAKSYTMAKNASMSDYRRATGFEALMGYLYLTNQTKRMMELILAGLNQKQHTNGGNDGTE